MQGRLVNDMTGMKPIRSLLSVFLIGLSVFPLSPLLGDPDVAISVDDLLELHVSPGELAAARIVGSTELTILFPGHRALTLETLDTDMLVQQRIMEEQGDVRLWARFLWGENKACRLSHAACAEWKQIRAAVHKALGAEVFRKWPWRRGDALVIAGRERAMVMFLDSRRADRIGILRLAGKTDLDWLREYVEQGVR